MVLHVIAMWVDINATLKVLNYFKMIGTYLEIIFPNDVPDF